MTTVDLYNMALNNLGHDQTVLAITDVTAEATWCNRFYDQSRREALRLAKPNWATITEALDDQEVPDHPKWEYSYPRPGDCMAIVGVTDSDGTAVDYSLQGANILTNCDEGYVEYISDETDLDVWDPQFVAVVAAKLAAYVAYPLTGKVELRRLMEQVFQTALSDARVLDANEDRNVGDVKDHDHYQNVRQ